MDGSRGADRGLVAMTAERRGGPMSSADEAQMPSSAEEAAAQLDCTASVAHDEELSSLGGSTSGAPEHAQRARLRCLGRCEGEPARETAARFA